MQNKGLLSGGQITKFWYTGVWVKTWFSSWCGGTLKGPGCTFIVEGVRLPAVLALQAVMQGFKALRVQKVQKGAKRGGPAVTGRLPASWRAFTLSLHWMDSRIQGGLSFWCLQQAGEVILLDVLLLNILWCGNTPRRSLPLQHQGCIHALLKRINIRNMWHRLVKNWTNWKFG